MLQFRRTIYQPFYIVGGQYQQRILTEFFAYLMRCHRVHVAAPTVVDDPFQPPPALENARAA